MGADQTSTTTTLAQPNLQAYTSTLPVPAPTSVPVLGVSSPISTEWMSSDESLAAATESQNVPMPTPKCCHIIPTLVWSSDSPVLFTSPSSSDPSTKSASYLLVVVPELTIPAEAHPDHLNRPGGDKEYLCSLCTFRDLNLDFILTHIRKHLDFTISCPVCCKGYQNAASLCKQGRDVHNMQIVALADAIPTQEY